jgi:hypothetical protein
LAKRDRKKKNAAFDFVRPKNMQNGRETKQQFK